MLRTHPRPTGYPGRQLRTLAPHRGGGVNLRVPKLRRQTFETAIIERYRRQESSVEEALIEMHLAGISVRRVEDITRRSGTPVSAEHGVEPEQKDLRQDRGLSESPDRGRACVSLPRRGRVMRSATPAGGLCRNFGRILRDPGHRDGAKEDKSG